MTKQERARKDAHTFLNNLVRVQKLMRKTYKSLEGVEAVIFSNRIQMDHLIHWCQLLDMDYVREDWDGNSVCCSNWDIVYFEYEGFKFFDLVEKEEK